MRRLASGSVESARESALRGGHYGKAMLSVAADVEQPLGRQVKQVAQLHEAGLYHKNVQKTPVMMWS